MQANFALLAIGFILGWLWRSRKVRIDHKVKFIDALFASEWFEVERRNCDKIDDLRRAFDADVTRAFEVGRTVERHIRDSGLPSTTTVTLKRGSKGWVSHVGTSAIVNVSFPEEKAAAVDPPQPN